METQSKKWIKAWAEDAVKNKKDVFPIFNHFKNNHSSEDNHLLSSELHKEVTDQIDCLDCANCCKTTVTTFREGEIQRAAKYLGLSKKAFIKQYLINDMDEFTTISTPCPLLNHDNTCKIYEVRPLSCSSFPHTQKEGFFNMPAVHQSNYKICPITYHVLNKMEELMNKESKHHSSH